MAVGAEQDQDRNEAATPHKLQQARERGQVAKSAEVVGVLVLAAGAAVLYAKGWAGFVSLLRLDAHLLGFVGSAARQGPGGWWLWDLTMYAMQAGLALMLPVFAVLLIVALLANLGQTGPVWSWHPVKPDWSRLNPVNGFKRVVSLRTLFDLLRTLLKLLVLGLVVGLSLRDLLPQFANLSAATPRVQAEHFVTEMGAMALRLAFAMAFLALLDLGFTRREFTKNMRMSRRELRDEVKNREGDPRIRARLRELRREMLKRSASLQRTASADLLITNPTHYAVALRYRHGETSAPVVVSKGAGLYAAAMRAVAARHRIVVLRSPTLARALHAKGVVGAPIPVAYYPDVARLMVWVLAMKKARQAQKGLV